MDLYFLYQISHPFYSLRIGRNLMKRIHKHWRRQKSQNHTPNAVLFQNIPISSRAGIPGSQTLQPATSLASTLHLRHFAMTAVLFLLRGTVDAWLNPLSVSWLENQRTGAWWPTVHGVHED